MRVRVPAERLERWVANFRGRHGDTRLSVVDGALVGVADDGSRFAAHPPFGPPLVAAYDGPADPAAVAAALAVPPAWGVLLVRKGGYAVGLLEGAALVASKTGQRHVQGRTKAGGQSQQRFARRRDNQAREAYAAAADHAARVLAPLLPAGAPVVVGGDREALAEVLDDPRLARLERHGDPLPVPDPRRSVLEVAVADALAHVVDVENA